jgi:hypothetical protein
MIENAALLKSAAGQIDEIDVLIRGLQDDKKTVFDNIKESVEPPTFKAWKEAVKLRQKRRVDKDALEAHDSRVWAVLAMLEASGTEHAVNTSRAPAGGEPSIEFEEPRSAGLAEIREAFKNGKSISQDFRFQNGEVYFAHFDGIGRVKIGVSTDAVRRVADLSRALGLEPCNVAIIPGNRRSEQVAHSHFERWRIAGEWFSATDECVSEIKSYVANAYEDHDSDSDRLETLIAEAEAFLPPYDPDTGEITDPISSAHCLPDDSDEGVSHLRSAAGEQVSSVPPRPLAGSIDMGDIPEALDRRKRREVAA